MGAGQQLVAAIGAWHAPIVARRRSVCKNPRVPPAARTFVAAGAVLFAATLVQNLFVLAPRYLSELGHSEAVIGAVMGAFHVSSLIAIPAVGRLVGRYGMSRPLVIGGLVAAAGTALFAVAEGGALLGVARALQGVGFGAGLVGGFAAVAEVSAQGSLARSLGITGIVVLLSQALGPAAGEVLLLEVGWNGVFVAGGIASLLAALAALPLPAGRREVARMQAPRAAIAALVATLLAGAGFGAVWSFLSDFAEKLNISTVSPFFLAYVGTAVAARLALGGAADRFGHRAIAAPTLLLQAAALALLVFAGSVWHLVGSGVLFGVGHGLSYPALQALVVTTASRDRARAMAAAVFAFGIGVAGATLLLGLIAEIADYEVMYAVAAALSAGGAAALAAARQP